MPRDVLSRRRTEMDDDDESSTTSRFTATVTAQHVRSMTHASLQHHCLMYITVTRIKSGELLQRWSLYWFLGGLFILQTSLLDKIGLSIRLIDMADGVGRCVFDMAGGVMQVIAISRLP